MHRRWQKLEVAWRVWANPSSIYIYIYIYYIYILLLSSRCGNHKQMMKIKSVMVINESWDWKTFYPYPNAILWWWSKINTTQGFKSVVAYYIYIMYFHVNFRNGYRVIILNRGSMPRKRTGRNWYKFSRPECATSLETARSLANGPSWRGGGLREKYVFCIPQELQRLLSLFCLWEESVGGENSLQWKANMLPLFSIMILWKWHQSASIVMS